MTAGRFDLLVELVCRDRREPARDDQPDPRVDGVVSTESFVYLELRKQLYDWGTQRARRRRDSRTGPGWPHEHRGAEPASRSVIGEPGEKGLKSGALGFVSSVVIGVASTAPGYSLAATLGFVAAVVGFQAPAIMLARLHPDAADRGGLLLPEPRRPGLRHDLLLGCARRSGPGSAGSAAGRSSSPTSS